MAIRSSTAKWEGDLKAGNGTMTIGKDRWTGPFSFATRFEENPGTNPEELVAAAHAGCFSMALSGQLTTAGTPAERIATTATVTMDKTEAGFTVTGVHLDVEAKVPGASQESFDTAASNAKSGCPISRLLNTQITMTARLVH